LDDGRIEALAERRATAEGVPWPPAVRHAIVTATLAGLRELAARRRAGAARFAPAPPGRMATIESFAVALGETEQRTIALADTTGWAKVPDVRGFPFRETFSYDGSGFGSPQALVLEADALFGTRPAWYLAHPWIATSMYLYLKSFR